MYNDDTLRLLQSSLVWIALSFSVMSPIGMKRGYLDSRTENTSQLYKEKQRLIMK